MTDQEIKPMEITESPKSTSKYGFVNSTDIGELYDNFRVFQEFIKTNKIDITDRNCPLEHITTLKKYHTELKKREEQMDNYKKRIQETTSKGKDISHEVLDSFGQFETPGGKDFNTFVACTLEIVQKQDIEIAKLREANTKIMEIDQLKNGNNKRSSSYRGLEEVEEQLSKRAKLINESPIIASEHAKGTAPKVLTYDPLNGLDIKKTQAAGSFLANFVSKDYGQKFHNLNENTKEYLEKTINTQTTNKKPTNVTMDGALGKF